jgi:hypothetical protein
MKKIILIVGLALALCLTGCDEGGEPASKNSLEGIIGNLLILQAYGTGEGGAGVNRSFVELYNNSNKAINLSGYYLWYANGTTVLQENAPNTATSDDSWEKVALSGTIPAKGSFLILGPVKIGSSSPRHNIAEEYGDINSNSFILSNRAFKVALIHGKTELTDAIQNPFNKNGKPVTGYIDMVGAANEWVGDDSTGDKQDAIFGFETAPARNSGSEAVRRRDLTDTDSNSADFIAARYASGGFTDAEVEVRKPRNSSAGAWDPFADPTPLPVITNHTRDVVSPTPADAVTVSAPVTIQSPGTIASVVLKWKLDTIQQTDINMTNDGDVYSGTILAQAVGKHVEYTISAANNKGNIVTDTGGSYTVQAHAVDYTKLKINEVSGVGADSAKFYELINTGTNDIPLEGVEIYYNANGSTGQAMPAGEGNLTWTGLPSQTINAGQLFSLIGRDNPAGTIPGSFTTGLTAARKLIITLKDPAGNVLDQCIRAEDTGSYAITDKSYSRIPDGTGDFYFTTPTPNETNGTSTEGLTLVPEEPLPPPDGSAKLMILQVGSGANDTDTHVSHSFVELYNNTTGSIDLSGYSLQFATGTRTDHSAGVDGDWVKIDLSGTIPARHSFLILRDEKLSLMENPNLSITNGSGDMNEASLTLSNRSIKVVLLNNTTALTSSIQNPFDTDGNGTKVAGYVDMVGITNTNSDTQDRIRGFEAAVADGYSKQRGARRRNLEDTDNNSADFGMINYNNVGTEGVANNRPRNVAYGAWDPITFESE